MRLSEDQRKAILETAREYFGSHCQVVLFGSRVDDDRRGGDIDLFVDVPMDSEAIGDRRISFLVALKKRIGDRKIDVIVRATDSCPKPIHDVAKEEGIVLQ